MTLMPQHRKATDAIAPTPSKNASLSVMLTILALKGDPMKYLITLALVASSLVAQVTLNETTTAATMTAAQTTAQLASTSNVLNGYLLYIVDTDGQPGELVAVTKVTGNTVTIQRGRGGYQVRHATSARVIIGPNSGAFGNAPKVGGCSPTDTPFTPWVDVSTGITYTCTSGAWIATNQGGGGSGSLGVQSDGTLVGTQSIMNFLPDSTITPTITNDGGNGRVNVQHGVNTSVIPTKATAQGGAMVYCASTISTAAHSCSLNPSLTAYTTGQVITWIPSGTMVAGAQTLNVDAQGAVAIKKIDGSDPASGDIVAGRAYTLTKLASAWQVTAGLGGGINSQWYPAASCADGMLGSSSTSVSCVDGLGLLQFRSVTTNFAYVVHRLKTTILTASIRLELTQTDGSPTGVWPIEVKGACVATGGAIAPTWGVAIANSVTVPANETRVSSTFNITPSGTCSAGSILRINLFHNLTGDTGSGQWAKIIGVEVVE